MTKYNGYANHATWQANLHLSNDYGIYLQITELAEQSWRDAVDWRDYSYSDNRKDYYRYLFEDRLKTYVDDWFHDVDETTGKALAGSAFAQLLMSDIFSSWMSDVDWLEIAGNWIDDPADEFGIDDEAEADPEDDSEFVAQARAWAGVKDPVLTDQDGDTWTLRDNGKYSLDKSPHATGTFTFAEIDARWGVKATVTDRDGDVWTKQKDGLYAADESYSDHAGRLWTMSLDELRSTYGPLS